MADGKSGNFRLRASYVTSIFSIMLVLFMLGLLGLIVLHGRKLSDYIRENISISVILKESLTDKAVLDLRQRLQKTGYVKSSEYITKDQAARELTQELGEDFVQFLGYNPLPASLDLKLKAEYARSDSIALIEKKLMASDMVKEVVYQKPLIDQLNANINRISVILLVFSMMMMIISVLLINNTIKLSIYSKRFLIRSMQLIGATESFIRMPFIRRSLWHGALAAFVTVLLLSGVLWFALQKIPELGLLQDFRQTGIFFGGILLLGVFLSAFSTWFSLNKFLKMKVDQLYTH
jgi:cell division transport system permease protein